MKKFFLFLFMFLSFSSLAFAQRVDVTAADGYHTITLLKAKILRFDKLNADDKVNFLYDVDNKVLYLNVHGKPNGTLHLQNKDIETLEQCVNRLLDANSYLFSQYKINKVVLLACYESERHENKKDLSIGYANSLNVPISELAWNDGKSAKTYHVKNGYILAVIYNEHFSFSSDSKKEDKRIAKKAAKENNAEWAIPVIKDI